MPLTHIGYSVKLQGLNLEVSVKIFPISTANPIIRTFLSKLNKMLEIMSMFQFSRIIISDYCKHVIIHT